MNKDVLYLESSSLFLKRIWDLKLVEDEYITAIIDRMAGCETKDGRIGFGHPYMLEMWKESEANLTDRDGLVTDELLYFEIMRQYLRDLFNSAHKRSCLLLRDILAWTEFHRDHDDATKVYTFRPELWQWWLESVAEAKANYYRFW